MESCLTAFYSPVATITEDEEKARKAKMSIIIERYKHKVSALSTDLDHHLSIMAVQDDFQALPTDIFLASTTWLKALSFAIMNRTKFNKAIGTSCQAHPLLTISPHDCVPFIETESFLNNPSYANGLLATHIPYTSLPKSIISSDCRIVYICRNPKDVLISLWHFLNKVKDDASTSLVDIFELFSGGMSPGGPFWDHVIGYHKASLERPNKVLFLKYEDLKKDTKNEVKKLAKFIGDPFTEEEESDGSIEKIIELCGFKNLREVNKVSSNDIYFRKGVVGDSCNYLTTDMIQILDRITKEKFDEMKLEDAFELFSKGVTSNGSCWDHVIGYYKASIERPDKVLFLNYEKMKNDPKSEVWKLATFIGHPFEEGDGEMEEIINLCSFKKLSEVNKANKDAYFRKGEIGDSVNYLNTENDRGFGQDHVRKV
ncbi:hypothetical protein M8C21_026194 [Ambrosia artemisiifolia]|uniref:Sulfotransferase n=1 Tax=Ambrosia artemisiifolia TaxID=4212 RepID=A0AAD5GWX8_AMBAR|nr:hypothetical protein M8C21_026194 [Ambrosia artemisiifolia]